ncbi:DUF1801 domain-containing protein [Undibacterium luofuense]|uniref:DUF1801 domain-containing protein n=1 Tax=Undibacterium luofuense TaxID=2828733 RepID=A0A941DTJ5_9BURK|nr:DUF1801 domain-containing protein [Undibacterium luofuense]MBR7783781.1 DUF1801 domain-containing protein [Undibacterium luofuense]
MSSNKTVPTDASVSAYLANISNEARRKDCEALAELMSKATGQPAVMWGTSIVGFGSYHYRYDSGREGDMCVVGFAARKNEIAIYGLNAASEHEKFRQQLGKHKVGAGCLYIRSLENSDLNLLQKWTREAFLEKINLIDMNRYE